MEKVLSGYVGFGNLPNQVLQKSVSSGFDFTLMVVGASGLGKSTLINSLFSSEIYSQKSQISNLEICKTTKIQSKKMHICENEINLSLNLVDTPGFADNIDNSNCWEPILCYIHDMFEEYFENESKIHRSSFDDNRVHCCLYFISPNGRGLRDLDVSFMKVLHDKVNIIPIIAKADTFSCDELIRYKQQILEEIRDNSINIYDFSYNKTVINDDDISMNTKFIEKQPFGIVGSNRVIQAEGRIIYGREYPWGIIDINNPEHCDFRLLKDVLIRYHMQNMKDLIHTKLYEHFRSRKLRETISLSNVTGIPPLIEFVNDELESKYSSTYNRMLQNHNEYINDVQLNILEFDKDMESQKLYLKSQQEELLEEKKVFEEDHANFVISVNETGRTGSIGGKKTLKKGKN